MPPKADMFGVKIDVCFVPKADIPPVPRSAVRDCLGAARGFDFPLVVDRTEHQRSKFGFAD